MGVAGKGVFGLVVKVGGRMETVSQEPGGHSGLGPKDEGAL